MAFDPGYEVALHHSGTFRAFSQETALRLVQRYRLRGKRVIEIGCGSGYFLRLICELGDNHGVGFDTTVARVGTEPAGGGTVELVRDYYTDRHAQVPCDLICCLSVFEDIPRPMDFLHDLRSVIGERDTVVYFEVFNAFRAFQRQETWSVHYEQCNYFSEGALAGLFERCGFEVLDVGPCYEGDQYLYVEAVPRRGRGRSGRRPSGRRVETPAEIRGFADRHREKVDYWTDRLRELATSGRRGVVWGSGGKSVSFLAALGRSDVISHVVDINPDRQGKCLPGAGQLIVAPSALTEIQPDVVIMTNRMYESEIRDELQTLGLTPELLAA